MITHLIGDGDATTWCCGKTPFELLQTDRISLDSALLTCLGMDSPRICGTDAAGADLEGRGDGMVTCLFCEDSVPVPPKGAMCTDCGTYAYRQDNGRWKVYIPVEMVPHAPYLTPYEQAHLYAPMFMQWLTNHSG